MKCKYCKGKMDILDWIFSGRQCYYCALAEHAINLQKIRKQKKIEEDKKVEKVKERMKYFRRKKQ